MKEIDEKELEQAAGGHASCSYYHRTNDCCDAFEPDYDPTLPEETTRMMHNCGHCVHGERVGRGNIGCLKNVPGSGYGVL